VSCRTSGGNCVGSPYVERNWARSLFAAANCRWASASACTHLEMSGCSSESAASCFSRSEIRSSDALNSWCYDMASTLWTARLTRGVSVTLPRLQTFPFEESQRVHHLLPWQRVTASAGTPPIDKPLSGSTPAYKHLTPPIIESTFTLHDATSVLTSSKDCRLMSCTLTSLSSAVSCSRCLRSRLPSWMRFSSAARRSFSLCTIGLTTTHWMRRLD
jgi:hypothetical protein